MRKSFLMYLFVFTALLAIFFYVNGNKIVDSKEQEIELLKSQLEEAKLNSEPSSSEALGDDTFSLINNEEALTYLENRGFEPSEIIAKVEEELISRNTADADNELIPYEGMAGHFRINKVKLLNHKWAIASFTDGSYWGDLFVSYEIDDDGNIDVATEKAVLYPN
ncbi:hypothetical protein HC174_07050 [Salinimicrobium sp. CDJ15-81-2]|nr:hypothetical protein [Salinimicrobium nanhaiense]